MPRIVTLAAGAAAVALMAATSSASSAAATLSLRATMGLDSALVRCPPDVPPDGTDCRARTEQGRVPGLGSVSAAYVWSYRLGPPTCPSELAKPLATTGRLTVAGKGELQFALAQGAACVDIEPVRNEPQEFTITGGTGIYAGASGSGTVQRSVGMSRGSETWIGTLVAPGVEFDVTTPVLSGATSKTVRARKGAKRVRVTYRVTASDTVDGAVRANCAPGSGSRFPIGRTVVKCSAEDSSANTASASFGVTVRATR